MFDVRSLFSAGRSRRRCRHTLGYSVNFLVGRMLLLGVRARSGNENRNERKKEQERGAHRELLREKNGRRRKVERGWWEKKSQASLRFRVTRGLSGQMLKTGWCSRAGCNFYHSIRPTRFTTPHKLLQIASCHSQLAIRPSAQHKFNFVDETYFSDRSIHTDFPVPSSNP